MNLLRLSILCLLSTTVITSCVKQEYDSPPDTSKVDPMLSVHTTLRNLSDEAVGMADGQYRKLGDSTIYGIVVADDHSGNFYKQIIIQDTSGGGMIIMLDLTTIYGDYPVGRKVYVKMKGLLLTNYRGLPEIIYGFDEENKSIGIPSSIIKNYIVKASFPNTVKPTVVTISDIYFNTNKYLNTLIKIENMEFKTTHDVTGTPLPYSDPTKSTTRIAMDCPYSGTVGVYNSNYSNFHATLIPDGKGSLTGILSKYNNPQFLIRDTTDVQFTQPRACP